MTLETEKNQQKEAPEGASWGVAPKARQAVQKTTGAAAPGSMPRRALRHPYQR
jgi:hypothetical protein